MAHALRTAWNASRHWLATGFLASTILFLLLVFINWRNEHRGIASQKATGLTSVPVDSASAWHQKSILPWSSSERHVRSGLDSIGESAGGMIGGVLGGVPGSVRLAVNGSQPATPLENTERMVVRTGTLEIIVVDPVQAAEQLRDLATHLSGFVVSSRVSGSDERTRSAQVTVRIPAKYFDEARTQVRRIAKTVEQDTVEARDATREYVDQEARLRNTRAEEARYLAILKRTAMVKDVLEVSSKLAEVRGALTSRTPICVFSITRWKCLCSRLTSVRCLKHKRSASIGGRSMRRSYRCAVHLSVWLTTPTPWWRFS
jgi:Domain of unknown function (DUF4349)